MSIYLPTARARLDEKLITNLQKLIEELEVYYQQGSNVFRGQPSQEFHLQPKAFRSDGIGELSKQFPASPYYELWFSTEEFKKIITGWLNASMINHLWVSRLCDLAIYIMKYNYSLAQHGERPAKPPFLKNNSHINCS
jgi:hypothetical protein